MPAADAWMTLGRDAYFCDQDYGEGTARRVDRLSLQKKKAEL
jgi:hypothetical protein